MALILSLREGESFYVGDERIKVIEIKSTEHFLVRTPDGTVHDVVGDEAVEVLPDVMISAGLKYEYGHARVAIDAPRSIVILREAMYRNRRDR